MISIIKKVIVQKEVSFSSLVSSRDPFGYDIRLPGSFKVAKHKFKQEPSTDEDTAFYYNGWRRNGVGYVAPTSINCNKEWRNLFKVLIPKAWGTGKEATDKLTPFIAEPNSVCTETYLVVGPFQDKITSENVISYINTKFFHAMVSVLKIAQNATQSVYQFVPVQDFSKPWTDAELYEKYKLTEDEIAFIESMIRPMP
jgi:site-specific DNA-methyltransferase (adenine-specific)